MNRLYVFAIGGTGARVLKSLTMLLAAGVSSKEKFEIVPLIIDPHKGNEDLKRTERLLSNYQSIQNKVSNDHGLFGTKINTLDKFSNSERLSKSFTFGLKDIDNTRFQDYIDFSQLDESNKALADLLFSGKSSNKRGEEVPLLDVEMDIGFVGNPNIGSVVLNQLKASDEFKEFANSFKSGDRIFIISSIFGGTGAAGFPTLLKHIRDAKNNPNIDSKGLLENAPIGAISVLPYFNIEKSIDSPIQKSDFIAKTKSALHYYKENICDNKTINALYYLGDELNGKGYKNDPGQNGQENPAHVIELIAALSILDFLDIPVELLTTLQGNVQAPIYKGFGIRNRADELLFSDWCDGTQKKITLPFSQLALFKKYIDEQLNESVEKQSWSSDDPQIDQSFLQDTFFRTFITEFMNAYTEWLNEMESNKRGFAPFNLNSPINSLIRGKEVKKGLFSSAIKHSKLDGIMNKQSKNKDYANKEEKFITLQSNATEELLVNEFGIKKS